MNLCIKYTEACASEGSEVASGALEPGDVCDFMSALALHGGLHGRFGSFRDALWALMGALGANENVSASLGPPWAFWELP